MAEGIIQDLGRRKKENGVRKRPSRLQSRTLMLTSETKIDAGESFELERKWRDTSCYFVVT